MRAGQAGVTSEADCVKSYDHLLGPGAGGTQAEEADTRGHAGDSTSGSGVHHSEVSNMGLSWVNITSLSLVIEGLLLVITHNTFL